MALCLFEIISHYKALLCIEDSLSLILYLHSSSQEMPVLVAAQSKAWVCGRLLPGIACSNPAGAWMSATCEYCVLYR